MEELEFGHKTKKDSSLFICLSKFKRSSVTQQEQKAFTTYGSWYFIEGNLQEHVPHTGYARI
jgi:hypothetical protein